MKTAPHHEFSDEQKKALAAAIRLEWLTLAYLATVTVLMYMVMGSSQAMKTAWIEDLLSAVPPVAFLIANYFRNKKPTRHFPYGFHRAGSVGFLVAALSLAVVGGYLVVDAAVKLIHMEHPSIGMKSFFGIDLWLGWWMLPVLLWGTLPPVLLGRAKKKLAETINDKILYTDAKMNKADWMTAVAAIVGVLGIGLGWWWADATAALFISYDIVKDGLRQGADAVTGLINRAPTNLQDEYIDLPDKAIAALESFPWVEKANVRLHEQGHLFFGEGFVFGRENAVTAAQIDEAVNKVGKLDWRLQGFVLTVVKNKSDLNG